MALLAAATANTAIVLLTKNWVGGGIDCCCHEVPQRPPHFSSASKNCSAGGSLPPSTIIYNTQSRKTREMSQSFSNNINSFNNFTVADDRSSLLAWLSPLNPKLRHQDIRNRRVEDVGEWVFQTEEFKSWYAGSGGSESDKAVLFCYGDPGVGKTFIR